MKIFGISGVLMGMITALAYGDPLPIVTASGKMITASIPSITFTLTKPSHKIAKTRVFTMTGQEIAELNAQSVDRFTWDGKDVDQQPVEPGLYVVQIHQGKSVWHGPVMVNR